MATAKEDPLKQENGPNGPNGPERSDADTADSQPKEGRSHKLPRPKSLSLKKAVKPKKLPGGFDQTPLPDAPPGYTVRFGFRHAANLPPGDLSTVSSDPFLTATLKASNPKRHKEDPDLVYRTQTRRRTTEPEWNEDWVVANVPVSGFTLKCRLYDEDSPDQDDRLGNVTVKVPQLFEGWDGIPAPGKEFEAKKRMISKRALVLKTITSCLHSGVHVTPRLCITMEILGKSDPPHAQMYTVGPTRWTKHFSPMIGRLTGTKVNTDADQDQEKPASNEDGDKKKKKNQKYDFQANEMQLQGPVPPELYHRYVEFRPIISSMYKSSGLRGKILNLALHKQHNRIYNFDQSTEWGSFEPCSEEATLSFLRLAHFAEGSRVFTYVLTLDGMLRFTETGKEFGIDLLSKHTMHSNVDSYIAFSGEFFIRRLERPDASDDATAKEKNHSDDEISGGSPQDEAPPKPSSYQLHIDNDSGTYRPDKSMLPKLKGFLEKNFPGLGVVAMHWEDERLQEMKQAQHDTRKKEGRMMNLVMNRSMSSISSAESKLDARDATWETGGRSKREAALAAVEDPTELKQAIKEALPGGSGEVLKPAT
ncbi:hypothetical protein E4U42_000694 [Claviceps africana]|uniref:C2 domain-containing protein n=1 Tax=Claviceps africana TaxID=83212 RepID=A0A8K0JFZ2_9HYPO|nr:hypothetical protein E4U42_000694 [Claviceps africana]